MSLPQGLGSWGRGSPCEQVSSPALVAWCHSPVKFQINAELQHRDKINVMFSMTCQF